MEKDISNDIVGKWLKAWCLSRELPSPSKYKSGFKVNVNDEKQKTRYVFAELNDDFFQLANSIEEPWIFLKVCTAFDDFKDKIPEKWKVQPQGYMMFCFHRMNIPDIDLHENYKIEFDSYNSTFVVKIVTKNNELASIGRVVIVDDLAVYDRISTEINHKRKGLATFIMKELEKIALSKGVSNNFLVATEQGKSLYESLGWELYSLYTSVVIPTEKSKF
ncbi:GNAT family acetyltransferase [Chryseobacterium glaciei]|uniref:GNAT family acetyltransferase n=1 Tax=Chryseobacterium glaciei TaxID=1685010 RepID=A0A172XZR7_9FLAO|nr:GNAT family N-acetyltransferase [Chryseobacterium glaciei]ANF52356.1 GNAT family acetyltransferase [Chryseobacterium glaciei]